MRKKLLCVSMCVAMAASVLAGCGSKDDKKDDTTKGAGDDATTTTAASGEEGGDEVVAELGTKENPIPYVISNTPMENGKYYIEEGVVYLCNRSEAVLHHPLSALVGLYVVIAE